MRKKAKLYRDEISLTCVLEIKVVLNILKNICRSIFAKLESVKK